MKAEQEIYRLWEVMNDENQRQIKAVPNGTAHVDDTWHGLGVTGGADADGHSIGERCGCWTTQVPSETCLASATHRVHKLKQFVTKELPSFFCQGGEG
jgi:hypothetical protein